VSKTFTFPSRFTLNPSFNNDFVFGAPFRRRWLGFLGGGGVRPKRLSSLKFFKKESLSPIAEKKGTGNEEPGNRQSNPNLWESRNLGARKTDGVENVPL